MMQEKKEKSLMNQVAGWFSADAKKPKKKKSLKDVDTKKWKGKANKSIKGAFGG